MFHENSKSLIGITILCSVTTLTSSLALHICGVPGAIISFAASATIIYLLLIFYEKITEFITLQPFLWASSGEQTFSFILKIRNKARYLARTVGKQSVLGEYQIFQEVLLHRLDRLTKRRPQAFAPIKRFIEHIITKPEANINPFYSLEMYCDIMLANLKRVRLNQVLQFMDHIPLKIRKELCDAKNTRPFIIYIYGYSAPVFLCLTHLSSYSHVFIKIIKPFQHSHWWEFFRLRYQVKKMGFSNVATVKYKDFNDQEINSSNPRKEFFALLFGAERMDSQMKIVQTVGARGIIQVAQKNHCIPCAFIEPYKIQDFCKKDDNHNPFGPLYEIIDSKEFEIRILTGHMTHKDALLVDDLNCCMDWWELETGNEGYELPPEKPEAGFLARKIELPDTSSPRILEVGTGGIAVIAIKLAEIYPNAEITATDIYPRAVKYSKNAVSAKSLSGKISVIEGDLFDPIKGNKYDVIIWNIPQMPVPPNEECSDFWSMVQYDGGLDGFDSLRRLYKEAPLHLKPGGRVYTILLEFLGLNKVKQIIEKSGLKWIEPKKGDRDGNNTDYFVERIRPNGRTRERFPYIREIYKEAEFKNGRQLKNKGILPSPLLYEQLASFKKNKIGENNYVLQRRIVICAEKGNSVKSKTK